MVRFIFAAIAAYLPTTISHACENSTAQQMVAIRRAMFAASPNRGAIDALNARRHDIHERIRRALLDQSPDLAAIARLHREENSIQIKAWRLEYIASERTMAGLTYCDKVAYLRAIFPAPVTTLSPEPAPPVRAAGKP